MGSRFNPFAAVRRRNTAVEEAEQQQLDRTNLANRSMRDAQRQAGDYVAGRVAVARNQAEREAQAEQRARAARRGTEFGEQDIEDAEMMRNMREFANAAYGTTREDFNEGMNAAFQANRRQGGGGVRVDPSPPSQVLVQDASGNTLGAAQQLAGEALKLPAPPEGAVAENNKDNASGRSLAENRTDRALGGSAPAPDDDEEEEETGMSPGTAAVVGNMSPSLEQIQRKRQGGN